MAPLPEMFNTFFESPFAKEMAAWALEALPLEKLTSVKDWDPEKRGENFDNVGQAIHKDLRPQDKILFLNAQQTLREKLGTLSKPGADINPVDLSKSVLNQWHIASKLAKSLGKGVYKEFEDSTREFVISEIVRAENQSRDELRLTKDPSGKTTRKETYPETFNQFSACYHAQMLRKLVGSPPDALRIGKDDPPDEYYLWGVYGLKSSHIVRGLDVRASIAAYDKARKEVFVLFNDYGYMTKKADEKTQDEAGDYVRSPIESVKEAQRELIEATIKFYEATKDYAKDPKKSSEAKDVIHRSLALVESLRGTLGLANGTTRHTTRELPPVPSKEQREAFKAKFPQVIKEWDTRAEKIREDIRSKPDRSEPDHSKPDHSKPDHSKPDHSKPDHSKPDRRKPELKRQERIRK